MKFFKIDISQRTLNRKIAAFMLQADQDRYADFINQFKKPQCAAHTTLFLYCVWQNIKAQFSLSEFQPMNFKWLDLTMRRMSSWDEDLATLSIEDKTNFQTYIEFLISFLKPYLNNTLAQTDIEPFLADVNDLSAKRKYSIATHFNAADLIQLKVLELFTQDKQFVLICSAKHAMGLVCFGETIILYNPDSEEFMFFKKSAKEELAQAIFNGSGYDTTYSYPLGFIAFGSEKSVIDFPSQQVILSQICPKQPPTSALQQYTNNYSTLHISVKIACANSILYHLSNEWIETPAVLGMTCLHLAFIENHKFIIDFLMLYGANINALLENGTTLLYEMIIQNQNNIAKLLIEKGANIDLLNITGESPLKGAIQSQNLEMVYYLIDKGADQTFLHSDEIPFGESIYDTVNESHDNSTPEDLGRLLEEMDYDLQFLQQVQNETPPSDSKNSSTESLDNCDKDSNSVKGFKPY